MYSGKGRSAQAEAKLLRSSLPLSTALTASKGATKVTLNDFNSPRAVRIAKIALRGMRRDTALQEGFPPTGRRISLSWTIMYREAFPDEELKAKMEEAQDDDDLKAKLIAYTWNGSCQVRGTLIGKARRGVPVWYKLSVLQSNELKEAVDWLLEDDAFLHDAKLWTTGLDFQAVPPPPDPSPMTGPGPTPMSDQTGHMSRPPDFLL
ncbi:hypothetical protein DFH29DRAFT_998712 [Suillus ampliporus]|nr:hypothetical protein DFH29DRAFT_998712 [Suillus ampliporus]